MNEFKGTQGPWLANPMESDSESNLIFASTLSNGTRRLVASISTGSDALANRRLIAAAPTMYSYIESSAMNGCATAKKILEAINGNA